MADRKMKGLSKDKINDILFESSDEDIDNIECDELYDSDIDKDYVMEPDETSSEDSEESDDEKVVRRRRKRTKSARGRAGKARRPPPSRSPASHAATHAATHATHATSPAADPASPAAVAGPSSAPDYPAAVAGPSAYPASPTAGPSASYPASFPASPTADPDDPAADSADPDDPPAGPDDPATPAAAPSATPAAAPVARRGRRRARGEDDEDLLVNFTTDTVTSKSGYVWHTRPQVSSRTRTPARNIIAPFTPGPTHEAAQATTPSQCFGLFVSDEVIGEIVTWTNAKIDRMAGQFARQNPTVRNTSPPEMRALLGVLIFSGYRRDNHLSTKEVWSPTTGAAFYRAAMSEARFAFLLSCLRFDNEATREARRQHDKFAPIRSVWDRFISDCKKHYVPHETLTVDEQLLAFRGRCPFRMYIPNKPAKYGIKLVLANDVRSKYLVGGIPYLGKETRPGHGQNLGHILTKDLTLPYHHSNRNVTTDNWFTSVPLMQDLLHNCGMTLVGTVKGNKKEIPAVMKEKDTRTPGSTAFLFTKDMTFVSYVPNTAKAKKTVLLMSTMHTQQTLCQSGKPEIIEFYNKTKGGVDTFDQMCAQYTCSRKTKRWPLCVFYGILNSAVINSWIIHSENSEMSGGPKVKRKHYMEELAMQLVKPWALSRLNATTLPRQVRVVINTVCSQNPDVTPGVAGLPAADMREPMVRCQLCQSKKDKKTRFRCHTCSRPVCPSHYYPFCKDCL